MKLHNCSEYSEYLYEPHAGSLFVRCCNNVFFPDCQLFNCDEIIRFINCSLERKLIAERVTVCDNGPRTLTA
ncbi:hypothetical protein STEG23_015155 [Scotinomys teguina]